jgi:hypothetical protein
MTTVLVVPGAPLLLPPHPRQDPAPELREACRAAVAALPAGPVTVLAPPLTLAARSRGVTVPLGHRVADHLLGTRPAAAHLTTDEPLSSDLDGVLVLVADGSARRHEKAPGHLHPDAVATDDVVEDALRAGDAAALRVLDASRGDELWCEGLPGLVALGGLAGGREVRAEVSYADAPYGVAWWVARWDLEAPRRLRGSRAARSRDR